VVLHQRRLADRGRRQPPGPPLVIGHALTGPHLLAVPLGRPRRTVIRLDLRPQPQAAPHVVDDDPGDLLPRAEPRHLLEALQIQHQRQQRLRARGPLPRPGDLLRRRGEEHMQHPCRGQPLELRIGSALDRRHPPALSDHAEPGPTHRNGERSSPAPDSPNRNQPAAPPYLIPSPRRPLARCLFRAYQVWPRSDCSGGEPAPHREQETTGRPATPASRARRGRRRCPQLAVTTEKAA
jgi:hypothetical protein